MLNGKDIVIEKINNLRDGRNILKKRISCFEDIKDRKDISFKKMVQHHIYNYKQEIIKIENVIQSLIDKL